MSCELMTGIMNTDLRVVSKYFEVSLRYKLTVKNAVVKVQPIPLQLPQQNLICDSWGNYGFLKRIIIQSIIQSMFT